MLARMVGACQVADGGYVASRSFGWRPRSFLNTTQHRFATIPGANDADLRMTYCAFVICALLDDWSVSTSPAHSPTSTAAACVQSSLIHSDLPCWLTLLLCTTDCRRTRAGTARRRMAKQSADRHTARSQRYTSCRPPTPTQRLQPAEWCTTVRWLLQTHTPPQLGGGFSGRTNKLPDACYGFWCSAAVSVRPTHSFYPPLNGMDCCFSQILGAGELLDAHALGAFLAQCQFKFGGIGKAPGEHPGKVAYIPFRPILLLTSS
jgi:geranylgeranyl transferase type-1 subunit beta